MQAKQVSMHKDSATVSSVTSSYKFATISAPGSRTTHTTNSTSNQSFTTQHTAIKFQKTHHTHFPPRNIHTTHNNKQGLTEHHKTASSPQTTDITSKTTTHNNQHYTNKIQIKTHNFRQQRNQHSKNHRHNFNTQTFTASHEHATSKNTPTIITSQQQTQHPQQITLTQSQKFTAFRLTIHQDSAVQASHPTTNTQIVGTSHTHAVQISSSIIHLPRHVVFSSKHSTQHTHQSTAFCSQHSIHHRDQIHATAAAVSLVKQPAQSPSGPSHYSQRPSQSA